MAAVHASMRNAQRGAKRQPGGRARRVGKRARDRGEPRPVLLERGHAFEEAARIRVHRASKSASIARLLDDAARIHHEHAVGHLAR